MTIYADNAATTRLSDSVFQAMEPYLRDNYGNPSALYPFGREAKEAISAAKKKVQTVLHCQQHKVIFTSGGTEADNMALTGAFQIGAQRGRRHIITSAIEHPAVLITCKALQQAGADVTYLPASKEGGVSADDLQAAIRSDTALVSIMHANNEIGTIQDIKTFAKIAHDSGAYFHTDAVQTVGHIHVDVDEIGVDMLSFSAHKFYGPKGVGGLVHRINGLPPLIHGGGQQGGTRSGTENVAGIVGCGAAIEMADIIMNNEVKRIEDMSSQLLSYLCALPGVHLNGATDNRLPGNINISIDGVEGESVVLWLGQKGICVSAGSACAAGSLHGSHVLNAIGAKSTGSVRITLGRYNTMDEMPQIAEAIKEVVKILR